MLDYKYKTILKVALPLMISSFIQSIVLITDASFISRYSTLAFDAVGNSGLIYVTMYVALAGMGDGAQIIIARRIGQESKHLIGRIFGTSIIVHCLLALLLFAITQTLIPWLLNTYSRHHDLCLLQNQFIRVRSYALFFAMISLSIQAFFLANGKTWVVLIAALLTAGSNVIMDYLFIFGNGGFPSMGLEGAALASTCADGIGMVFLMLFLLLSKESKQLKLFAHFSFNTASFKELFRVGSPLMFQGFIALATWTIFFTWIEQIGKFELTVSQNIRSIYFLAFVPIWGFAGTTKTYISQYIGKKRFSDLKLIQRRIQFLSFLFLLLFFHGALCYPEKLIGFINPAEQYIQKSGEIMRFIFISILLYGFFSVYFQTINGSGNTIISFSIEVICVIIYILVAYVFIKVCKLDIFWIWSVEYIYFITMGILSILYLRYFNWKKKEV
jgi:MATE family multidrug resistance protein